MAINYLYSVVTMHGSKCFSIWMNVVAIVDLGGGIKWQYLVDKCCNESTSTLSLIEPIEIHAAHIQTNNGTNNFQDTWGFSMVLSQQ